MCLFFANIQNLFLHTTDARFVIKLLLLHVFELNRFFVVSFRTFQFNYYLFLYPSASMRSVALFNGLPSSSFKALFAFQYIR